MDVGYLKAVMAETGFLQAPSPGAAWLEPEENAWRQVCSKLGLNFTPYPSRENQDPYWLDVIDKKELVLTRPAQPAAVFDPRDLLPAPTKFDPDTPVSVMRKHSTLLDPDTPKEIASQYPHAKKLPRKFTRTRVVDPMENTAPNPVKRRAPVRASADKAARLNKVLQNDAPPRDPNKPIRVR